MTTRKNVAAETDLIEAETNPVESEQVRIESEIDESESDMTEPQVAKVIDPTAQPAAPSAHFAAPAPHLKPKWDESELDPTQRFSLAEDPTGAKNAARLAQAIERHQDKANRGG